jgi:DNA modification methylase
MPQKGPAPVIEKGPADLTRQRLPVGQFCSASRAANIFPSDSSDSSFANGTAIACTQPIRNAGGDSAMPIGRWKNQLFYGDNLEVLRRKILPNTVDLCYIDPPFNSQRTYNQIYNNIGGEDRAQAQAFIDTWSWDDRAIAGYEEIIANPDGRFRPQIVELIKGLEGVLGRDSLLAYLVSISLRVTEIQRVLKDTGTFYLHCDPTSSHYLKLVLDAAFCSAGGDFRNEIIWSYESGGRPKRDFGRKHDVIFRYTKSSKEWKFNANQILISRAEARRNHMKRNVDPDGRVYYSIKSAGKIYKYYEDEGVIPSDVWPISHLQQKDPERLGYPTQKPESLMERIIRASSDEGDVVLDAYCGCGTTIAVAEKFRRKWIGIDITYQSISLVQRRLEDMFTQDVLVNVTTDGIPRDMASAVALAHKKDDRLRKEFEKWAVLTYSNNRAVINEKKGADAGIDGRAYFKVGSKDNAKIIFQVKSGGVDRKDVATLRGDMDRERAAMAVLITLEQPTKPMLEEAKGVGRFKHEDMGRDYDRISIVPVDDIVEHNKRLEIPMSLEVLKAAQRAEAEQQMDWVLGN